MRIKASGLAAYGVEFLWRDQIGTGTGIPCELRHAHATVEVHEGADNGLAFRLRPCELHGIFKLVIRNNNSSFHASILAVRRIFVMHMGNLSLNILESC